MFIRDIDGHSYEILEIRAYVEAVNTGDGVHFRNARYRDAPIAYGHGESAIGDYTISLLQKNDGTPEGAMSIADSRTGEVRTVPVRFPADRKMLSFVTDLVNIPSPPPKKDR